MLRRILSLGAAAVAALTAACGDGPATVGGSWRSPATWSTMFWATAQGPMLVQIHGAPFSMDGAEFRTLVAEAMSDQVIGRVVRFTASHELARHPEARVVVAFDTPPDLASGALCTGEVATAVAGGDRIAVEAAFCHRGSQLAAVRGWVARGTGPRDKRFRQLLGQVVRELFGAPE